MGGLSGYFQGGMARGIASGARTATDIRAADNMDARTEIFKAEEARRAGEEGRKAEEYKRGMEPIALEDARKLFPDPVEADYVENFARSLGSVRKGADGREYVTRKDARELAVMLKNPQMQTDIADHKVNVYGEKLAAAEQAVNDNPYNEDARKALIETKRAYTTARLRHPGLAALDREKAKEERATTSLSPGSKLVRTNTGEVVAEGEAKPKELSNSMGIHPKTGKKVWMFKDGTYSDVEATKIYKGGDDDDDGEKEYKKEDRLYRRQERLDKQWEVREERYKKQYKEELDTKGEVVATENWNANVRSLQKDFKKKYEALGLNIDGSPIEKGAKAKPQAPSAPSGGGGQAQLFKKPDGSYVAIGPDGKEYPVEVKGNQVKFLSR